MRSQLTRRVFQRLLSNEALVFRCPTQLAISRQRNGSSTTWRAPRNVQRMQRRTFFGFSRKSPRQPKDPEIDPGLKPMLDLTQAEKLRVRPPPASELAKGFKTFVEYKILQKEAVNNIQAQHMLRTFKHLQKWNSDEEGSGPEDRTLSKTMSLLENLPKNDATNTHNELAKLLYAELLERTPEPNKSPFFTRFVRILSQTGDASDARNHAVKLSASATDSDLLKIKLAAKTCWSYALSGFAKENNEIELLKTLEMMSAVGIPYNALSRQTMILFYAAREDLEGMKKWFDKQPSESELRVTHQTLTEILRLSLKNNEHEWCNSVFQQALQLNLDKRMWDVILQWAAVIKGKSVDDVERMMEVMVRRNQENESIRPDSETINGLVELAASQNNPYSAERYIALGLKSGIRPNARTFILQMDYRIAAGDLAGVHVAYTSLQGEEIMDNEDLPVINKYIRALCSSKILNHDRISAITADLEERDVRLEADTVSSLTMMYLKRNDIADVNDILQTHSYHYTLTERARIRDTFVDYILDAKNSTAEVWTAYNLLRQIFLETPIEIRTQIMDAMFSRKRADMACHVFGHMRQHDRQDKRPILATYISCFEGIARCGDRECLDMVHNMFKMDSTIDPNTKLYNSLMLAYTACEDADRALGFWYDITNSREGPSYQSLEIVFRVCQDKPFGDRTAREIWTRMRRMEIEITREVFAAYVGAIAGQGLLDEAKLLVEGMETDVGFGPDMLTLATFYNAIPSQDRKDLIENWSKELYPEAWKEVEKLGRTQHEEGHWVLNLVRNVRA